MTGKINSTEDEFLKSTENKKSDRAMFAYGRAELVKNELIHEHLVDQISLVTAQKQIIDDSIPYRKCETTDSKQKALIRLEKIENLDFSPYPFAHASKLTISQEFSVKEWFDVDDHDKSLVSFAVLPLNPRLN